MRAPAEGGACVIGVGSPLMGDDGLGLVALERLRDRYDFHADVDLLDGGTWGMNLLPFIESAERVLILDAVRTGGEPGEVVTLERDKIPRFFATKISPHQIDLKEVLALAELRGSLPANTVVLGLEPAVIEMGMALSPAVEAGVDALCAAAVTRLAAWGYAPTPKVVAPGGAHA